MKAVVIILSIIAFAACLIIGIQAGASSGNPTASPATDTPNPLISPSQQRTLLIIVVDDLTQENPKLDAAWVMVYRPDLPKFTLLPLYPRSDAISNTPTPDLAGVFTLTEDRKPSIAFDQAVSANHFDWNGYIILDRSSVRDTIDWMQGIELEGSQVMGTPALASLIAPEEDPGGALRSQKRLISAICERTSHLPPEANWIGLASSFGTSRLSTNLNIETLIADWKTMMSGSAPYKCEIPTP